MRDFRLYNRVLSADDVQSLHQEDIEPPVNTSLNVPTYPLWDTPDTYAGSTASIVHDNNKLIAGSQSSSA